MALLRALLRESCGSDEAARAHLSEATRLGVDPLDYCAHRFGLGNALVWQRAAEWAGFRFAETTPRHGTLPRIDRLEHIAEARTLRQTVLGEDLTFYAPAFARVLSLAKAREDRASFGTHVRFVPPEAIEAATTRAASQQLMDAAQHEIAHRWPGANAADLSARARWRFVLVLAVLVVLVMAAGWIFKPVLVPLVAVLLMAPGLLRLFAAVPTRVASPARLLSDAELPVYTVLIPLRDEHAMVPQLARAMAALDYPPEKLDVKFVVESKSTRTVRAVERVLGDARFRLVEVPKGEPQTKPKALDYALPLARGKYLVVFDAEDVPDSGQLRLAASRFAEAPGVACLQAELVPENAGENVLTALFAGEYAGLFGRFLPALARWEFPVPLGGTSNHFRTEVLRAIGGWDAYNVTEDADLGMRLARSGLRAEMIASRTMEEAPLTIAAWMAQRTRWKKGWMQTFIVHNSDPLRLLGDIGWRGFVGFQLLVGGMILSSLLHTVFIGSLLGRLIFEGWIGFVPRDVWDWFSLAILATGYGGAILIILSGLIHQRALRDLGWQQLVLLFYWMLGSIASARAAWQLITKPDFWAKTTHGVTRVTRGENATERAAAKLKPRTG